MSKLTGFVMPAGDRAYFFSGDSYVRYDVAADAVDAGYPKPISGNWTGLWADGIDAVVVLPTNGKAYFFRGAEYLRYDLDADRADDGYPRPIDGNWPGLSGPVDAAIAWNTGKVYFFSGSTYCRYDPTSDAVDEGYPRAIADGWPGVFTSGIEAALWWPSGRVYFFSGGQYVRFDPAAGAADAGYPLPIAGAWSGLPFGSAGSGAGSGVGRSVMLRDYFPEFSKPLEGRIPYMYQDIKGLVTVAVGNLIDTPEAAAALPFVHKDSGVAATHDEIVAEWQTIKSDPSLAAAGHTAARKIATLVLTESAMDDLVKRVYDGHETMLAGFYADWATWPLDARLGAHSIAWAGANYPKGWPKLNAAAAAGDGATVAAESKLKEEGNPGVVPRNQANATLFRNAGAVLAQGLDRSLLYYPTAL